MKYITFIRHAKSSWENPNLADIERPLNKRGKEAVLLMGNYLNTQSIFPDWVISSPAVRATKTANAICTIIGYKTDKIQINPIIYSGSSADILTLIKQIENRYQDVFIFGHEPLLSELIFLLTGNKLEKFPTAAVYRISFTIKSWKNIGHGNCALFTFPKLLI